MAVTALRDESDYSTVLGGPLYQLFLRLRIVKPPLELLVRRVVVISLIAWLPCLLLAALDGQLLTGTKVPFVYDIDAQVRFLFSLPLLIIAEWVVHARSHPMMLQFLERNIVTADQRSGFDAIIDSSMRLRNSVLAEVVLIVLVATVGHMTWQKEIALPSGTWYGDSLNGQMALTPAGYYYAFVSLPIFQFILLRWYYRLLIWYRMLWGISRLRLNLIPTHPDRAGGLGFLQGSASALAPLLVAQSALLAGLIANRIFYDGSNLSMFTLEIAGLVMFLVLLVIAPLLLFAPTLNLHRRIGLRNYGLLASRYSAEFDQKWMRNKVAPSDPLLGSADIQSLADLGNSFTVVREMQPVPFGKQMVVRLTLIALLPIAPLALTMVPLDELIERLLHALL